MDEDRATRAFEDLVVTIREFRLSQERVNRVLEELVSEIVDQRAEVRAQTQAVLRLLDRFGNGPAPAS